MAIEYLKQAAKTPETETATARDVVAAMLAEIERRGEPAVREYAAKLDQLGRRDRRHAATRSSGARATSRHGVKRDIEFATAQVRRFALAQRESMREFSIELAPGRRRRASG